MVLSLKLNFVRPNENLKYFYFLDLLCIVLGVYLNKRKAVSHSIFPTLSTLCIIIPFFLLLRYVKFRDEVELDSIPGMVFCPRCKSRILSEPDSQVVVCDNEQCRFPFCRICQQTWHGLGPCPALDKVIVYFLSSPQ